MKMNKEKFLALPKRTFGQKLKRDFTRNWMVYLMFLPVFVYFIVFSYFPMSGIAIAFQNYELGDSFFGKPFTFNHFYNYFRDPYFLRTLRNTLIYGVCGICFTFPSSVLLALSLNAVKWKPFKRFIQTVSYMPYFISLVVVCGMISAFLDPYGFIGSFFQKMGWTEEGVSVLGDPRYFRSVIIITDIWQTIGFGSILYVASLSAIDPTLYEAADLDGAGRWKKLCHITIPSILPTLMMMLVLKVGTILSVGYEKIVLLYSGETWGVGETITSYAYRLGFVSSLPQYSYTTAIGLVNSVMTLVLLVVANYASRKLTKQGLL